MEFHNYPITRSDDGEQAQAEMELEAQESMCSHGQHIVHDNTCSACGLQTKATTETLHRVVFNFGKPSFLIRWRTWLMDELK